MKHTIQTLEAALKVIARKYKTAKGFNHAVGKVFPFINEGAFRQVYDGGTYAIKVRHSENKGSFDDEDIEMANEVEAQNYEALANMSPAVAFFVLAPVYVALPNGHDAILMRKVSVISTDKAYANALGSEPGPDGIEIYDLGDYVTHRFTPLMQEQYEFITGAFSDSHDDNIGWDFKTNRVWYIDYNHGADCCESDQDNKRHAKRLMKRITQSGKKAKAA